jgi:acyl carrier protein
MQGTEAKIRHFIVENYLYGENPDSLQDTDSFLARGIIDSAGILELVAFLEESFGITVNDDELLPENLDSISQAAGYVGRKTGSASTLVGASNAS